ncbi:MAG: glycosyltransferase [Planctomycetaceae bacterium]
MSEGLNQESSAVGGAVGDNSDSGNQASVGAESGPERVAMEEVGKISLEVLGLLPVTASRVLHLWSGRGALALKVRLRNPSVTFTCVDFEEEPTESSSRFADEVYRANPELLLMDKVEAWAGRYDAVVLDRGWENARNPRELVRAASEVVEEGGVVVIRQANGSSWWVVADLLAGVWDGGGTVGRGPYFSSDSVRAWIEGCGLQVMGVLGKKGRADVPEFARTVGVAAVSPDLSLEERVWRGVKARDVQRIHVAFFSAGARGCEDRVRAWLAALSTMTGVSVSVFEGRMQLPNVVAGVHKVLVLHRFFPATEAECLRVRQELEKKGWSVVLLLDEHPDDLPQGFRGEGSAVSPEILKICDGVMCAADSLTQWVGATEADVRVFEDGLLDLPVMAPRDVSKPLIYLTGLGGFGAEHPWVAETNRILLRNPNATLLMDSDRAVFDAIQAVNKRFVDRSQGVGGESFASCSIAILGEGQGESLRGFGRHFLRAASYGMACVAAGSVYEGIVRHGVTGALVGSASGYGEALEILIREPARCVSMARAARAWVSEKRMLSRTMGDQVAWLRNVATRAGAPQNPV